MRKKETWRKDIDQLNIDQLRELRDRLKRKLTDMLEKGHTEDEVYEIRRKASYVCCKILEHTLKENLKYGRFVIDESVKE